MPPSHQPVVLWPHSSLNRSIHNRELGSHTRPRRNIRHLYGHQSFIDDLDIVNELAGHTGCVNALSWSKSGHLLASGSDDKHVNIYRYQPEESSSQFSIATTVATGHSANIFSVKFMPYSNDRTLVTAAGDKEVRIFDLEHDSRSNITENHLAGRRRQFRALYASDSRWLSAQRTNCRVFRSHRERVKRIVTESSPHLFLTCSEDGEVRQWDIRQPSSAYPAHRFIDDDVPPPLISYRRYGLDLNTISCSPSQPHYIALGGAHLHCLLHDRRFIGRDRLMEAGNPGRSVENDSSFSDLMGKATRCVKKFAPNGQQRMGRNDSGHITACKISDANPNEMVVSWSADGIYSFDLLRSPDADDVRQGNWIKGQAEHKRKRSGASLASIPEASQRGESRPRTDESQSTAGDEDDMALRVQYANGQTEEIPIQQVHHGEDLVTKHERDVSHLAQRLVYLQSSLLDSRAMNSRPSDTSEELTGELTRILGLCASLLPEIKRLHASWTYAVDPSPLELSNERELRSDRESCIRFVQAAGVAARVLGGKLQNLISTQMDPVPFERVQVLSTEGPDITMREQFHVDFLKAIFLWLDSGIGALLEGFSPDVAPSGKIRRFPVPSDSDLDAIDDHLIPYLLQRADECPVPNVTASPFEADENLVIFRTEKDAVHQFSEAVKKPFADLSAGDQLARPDEFQTRESAIQFWGLVVSRGILKSFSAAMNLSFITKAFGGLSPPTHDIEIDQSLHGDEDSPMLNLVGDRPSDIEDYDETDDDNDDDSDDLDEDDETSGDASSDEEEYQAFLDEEAFSRQIYRSASRRSASRAQVEVDTPCVPHTKAYWGHCNVQTVKDVNFYGLNDEYVVSGSDDGNLFIWDRKTTKLVNILEGDGEVVNVLQGHPYEPMLAVSGIDDTIKIFSPDAKARKAARLGSGVEAADPLLFSSIHWPSSRAFGRRMMRQGADAAAVPRPPADTSEEQDREMDEDEFVATSGLASRKRGHQEYQITSRNDADRQSGGGSEARLTLEDILSVFFRRAG